MPLNVWMLHNNLKLNSDKTELLIFHAKHRPAPPLDCMNIGDLAILSSKSCMNISVTFDSYMNFDEHIKNICRIAFYYIRNIAKFRKCLSYDTAKIYCMHLLLLGLIHVMHFCLVCLTFLFSIYNMF